MEVSRFKNEAEGLGTLGKGITFVWVARISPGGGPRGEAQPDQKGSIHKKFKLKFNQYKECQAKF